MILVVAALVLSVGCKNKKGKTGSTTGTTGSTAGSTAAQNEKTPEPASGIKLSYKELAPGTTVEVSTNSAMDGKVSTRFGDKENTSKLVNKTSRKLKFTMLPPEDGKVKPAKIEVLDSFNVAVNPKTGKEEKTENPTKGKTYTAFADAKGDVHVQDADGKDANEQEAKLVTSQYKSATSDDAYKKWIADQTFAMNKPVDLPQEALNNMVNTSMENQKVDIDTATMKLISVDDEDGTKVATFETNMKFSAGSEKSPMGISAELAGKVALEVETGRTRSMELSGPIKITATSEKFTINGSGEMHVDKTATYQGKS